MVTALEHSYFAKVAQRGHTILLCTDAVRTLIPQLPKSNRIVHMMVCLWLVNTIPQEVGLNFSVNVVSQWCTMSTQYSTVALIFQSA